MNRRDKDALIVLVIILVVGSLFLFWKNIPRPLAENISNELQK